MNTLFLLLIAVVLLLMSHRFFGRVLAVFVFPPLAADNRSRTTAVAGLDIAASGGVLSLVGMSLALTWGWAPIYAWVLAACALLSALLSSAMAWTGAVSGANGLAAMGRVGGEPLATALRVALAGALLVWAPFVAAMLAGLVARYPAAAATLLAWCLLAMPLSLASGRTAAVTTVLAALVALPAGVGIAHALGAVGPSTGTALPVIAALAPLLAAAAAFAPRLLAPLGNLVALSLAALLVLALAAFVVEHPPVAYLGYASSSTAPSALPLVAICAGVGILPLLGAVEGHARRAPVAASTFEGLLAVVLLCALLAAPALTGEVPDALPDWNRGIDGVATLDYGIGALAALGWRLPLPPALVADGIAAVFAGLLLALLVRATATVRELAGQLAPAAGGMRLGSAIAVVAVLSALAAVFAWRGIIPVGIWLLAGELALLFAAGALGLAAFAAWRLRRNGLPLGIAATLLAVAFWWGCLWQAFGAVLAGDYPALAVQLAVAALGTWCTVLFLANAARLRALRQVR